MKSLLTNKATQLFYLLGGFFITNALIAEFIGVKIFSFEATVGIAPLNWQLLGNQGTLQLSAGVLLWPVVFIMTDIINEYYGKKGVQLLSYFAVGLILYAFAMVFGAIGMTPADWWVTDYAARGIPDMQQAFAGVFGQGLWIIAGSVTAFLLGQMVDVGIFHRIKRFTGDQKIWLRATGSTLVSQAIDSFVVLYIAFVLGADWDMNRFFAVGLVNYSYKFIVALLMTPIIYGLHFLIDRFLGKELAERMKTEAAGLASRV